LKQQELADELGVGPTAISHYESGRTELSALQLYLIAKKLKKPVGWFFETDPKASDALLIADTDTVLQSSQSASVCSLSGQDSQEATDITATSPTLYCITVQQGLRRGFLVKSSHDLYVSITLQGLAHLRQNPCCLLSDPAPNYPQGFWRAAPGGGIIWYSDTSSTVDSCVLLWRDPLSEEDSSELHSSEFHSSKDPSSWPQPRHSIDTRQAMSLHYLENLPGLLYLRLTSTGHQYLEQHPEVIIWDLLPEGLSGYWTNNNGSICWRSGKPQQDVQPIFPESSEDSLQIPKRIIDPFRNGLGTSKNSLTGTIIKILRGHPRGILTPPIR